MAELTVLVPTGRTIEIQHPVNGGNIGIRVDMLSIDDDRLTAIKRKITDERLDLNKRNKTLKAEQLEKNADRILWTAVTGWQWYNPTGAEGDEGYDADAMPTFDDEVPEFSQKNFFIVLNRLTWFRDQLNEEIEDKVAFLGN